MNQITIWEAKLDYLVVRQHTSTNMGVDAGSGKGWHKSGIGCWEQDVSD